MAKTARSTVNRIATNGHASASDLPQIIQPQVRDRWSGLIRRKYSADQVKNVLESTNIGGRLYNQQVMFELLEETWPRVGKNLHEIRTDVSRTEWIVQPFAAKGQKPSESAQEKAKFIEELIWGMRNNPATGENGLVDTIFDLMDAYGKGVAVLEIDWERRKGGVQAPMGTRWIKPVHYDYPFQATELDRLMLSVDGQQSGDQIDFPENKFIIGCYRFRSSAHIGRAALLRCLAPWWVFQNFSTEWLMQFAQIFGMPLRWANYKLSQDKAVVSKMLENMGAVAWGAFPEGTTIQFHEAMKGAGDNPNVFNLTYGDTLADLCILGQTLTSEVGTTGGNRALGEVHERRLTGRETHAAKWAGSVLSDQLIKPILRVNYGNDDEAPTIQPNISDPKDPMAMAMRDKTLFVDMGLPVSKDYLYDTHGVPPPQEGADLFEPPAKVAPPNLDPNLNADQNPADQASAKDMARYRQGQPGGGRFMSNQIVTALDRVKQVMGTWPSEGQRRSFRHIKAFGLSDNEAEFRSYHTKDMADEVDKRARACKETCDVPLKGLKTTQSIVDGDKVSAMLMSTADDSTQPVSKSPIVIKRSNKNWLWDGHHRAAKAMMLGQDTIKARMVDVEDLGK